MEIALFRYALIREATDPKVSKADRGQMVRLLADGTHTGPGGIEVRVGRSTVDQWIRAWRAGGFEALKPKPRALSAKVPAAKLDLAEALKRENAQRTAVHVAQILAVTHGWAPNERTIQRHFRRIGMTRRSLTAAKEAFGRFEATATNELWVGDALHGPVIGRHKAILFAYLGDHSRCFTGYRWVTAEDTVGDLASILDARRDSPRRADPASSLQPGTSRWSALGAPDTPATTPPTNDVPAPPDADHRRGELGEGRQS